MGSLNAGSDLLILTKTASSFSTGTTVATTTTTTRVKKKNNFQFAYVDQTQLGYDSVSALL